MKSFHEIGLKEKIPKVIELKNEGKSSREIARLLHISTRDISLIIKHYSPALPLDMVYRKISDERSGIVKRPVKPPEMSANITLTEDDIKAIAIKAYEMLERERQKNPTPTEKMRNDFTEMSTKINSISYKIDDLTDENTSIIEWIKNHDRLHSHLVDFVYHGFIALLIFMVIAWLLLYFEPYM